jgi:hypothetical protein
MDAAHDLVTEEEYYDVVAEDYYHTNGSKTVVLKKYGGNKDIRVVKIPDSVKLLRNATFAGCSNLERVEMGKNLASIHDRVFGRCENLKTIVWSSSLEYIGKQAFSKSGIETLKIPDGVKKIDDWAFMGCKELRSAYIPDTVEHMGFFLFFGCSKLLSVRLPRNEKLTRLEDGFCAKCDSLITLDIPENIHEIDKHSLGNKSLLAVAFHAPILTLFGDFEQDRALLLSGETGKSQNLKIIVYPDTEHNNREIEHEMRHMPNLQLIGLIQPTGKVNWHNRTGPLVAGLTDSAIASAGLTRSDIASLFPEKKAALMAAMINSKRINKSISGPPLLEIHRTLFPEVFAVEDFIRRYGGIRRVSNALHPGTWLD